MHKFLGKVFISLVCFIPLFSQATPTLRIAFSDNKAPYSSNCRCGLEFDLINYLVTKMGYQLEPFFVPNKRMALMLQNGEVDAIVDVPKNMLRAGGFTTLPYIQYHNVAISLQQRRVQVNTVHDLTKYRVVAFQNAAGNLGEEFHSIVSGIANYEEVSPQVIENHRLYSERADLVISDLFIFLASNAQVSAPLDTKQLVRIHSIFPTTEYSLEFKNVQLRDRFNYQLTHLILVPFYQSLQAKYLLPLHAQPEFSPLPQWMRKK